MARYDNFLVFCYGGYERHFLTRMRKLTKKKKEVDRVLKSLVNTLSLVYTHFYFPTYSNGLKDVGECLGCSWTDPGASGVQSIAWRMRWQATHERQRSSSTILQSTSAQSVALRSCPSVTLGWPNTLTT